MKTLMIVSVLGLAVACQATQLSSPGVIQKANVAPRAAARPASPAAAQNLSPEEMLEHRRMANKNFLINTGGIIVKPNSRVGTVAVIDTQSKLSGEELVKVTEELSKSTKMNFTYCRMSAGSPEALLGASKAKYAVIVTEDPKAPASLLALDDNWAIMNVAKMDRGLNGDAVEKFLISRCRKQLSRLLAILCGGSASQFPNNVMDIKKLEDLDIAVEGLPYDKIIAMTDYLKSNGFQEEVRTTYRKAVQEGWAPAPTNDLQRAIWDKVHEVPTKPLTIEPEKKSAKK